MLYLIMPDRFANGNQKTIAMLLQNTIAIYPAEDTAATFRDNKNLDYISSLGATAIWSTPLCEDNDKAYSIHLCSI
jgi:glycosidase